MYKNKIIILILLAIVVGLLIILPPNLSEEGSPPPLVSKSEEPEKAITLKISAVGDVMVHKPQLHAQCDSESDKYL